jgi:hypothetical protein
MRRNERLRCTFGGSLRHRGLTLLDGRRRGVPPLATCSAGNDPYSREDYGWWNDDANNPCVLLRYFIHPINLVYFS